MSNKEIQECKEYLESLDYVVSKRESLTIDTFDINKCKNYKKNVLVDFAKSLNISHSGTKDKISSRIHEHILTSDDEELEQQLSNEKDIYQILDEKFDSAYDIVNLRPFDVPEPYFDKYFLPSIQGDISKTLLKTIIKTEPTINTSNEEYSFVLHVLPDNNIFIKYYGISDEGDVNDEERIIVPPPNKQWKIIFKLLKDTLQKNK